ncbi:MAG TPA: hypothetical protein VKZ66_08840 [Pusillimonas sp.]|uniref:hypothetical protein n=1 Tax=unclassified Pusillimonas TaxID=2640016 RepID=UPI0026340D15|nr:MULTISPECIES: hypothetical protein [unclassified Pusillimonas]HLU20051.1 hypothetical protein [Pusillimonas sp.]
MSPSARAGGGLGFGVRPAPAGCVLFSRGQSATACSSPEARSAEVEFCRRPAEQGTVGEPEGPGDANSKP